MHFFLNVFSYEMLFAESKSNIVLNEAESKLVVWLHLAAQFEFQYL